MIGNAPEHVAQVRFGIHTVELGAPDQTVEDSGTLASAIGRQFIMPEFWHAKSLSPTHFIH
jgi:hypothetical protein